MALVTLRILDGADRGRIYESVPTPITVGREEGNTVQLNDDRVSRFHVKIQEDHEQVVLTDLESTNGTKVNGEEIQLRILRHGDMIAVGRSVLLFGSRTQIARRLASLRGEELDSDGDLEAEGEEVQAQVASLERELNWSDDPDMQATLHILVPPDLPSHLSPAQAAQLSELLEYLHIRIRHLLACAEANEKQQQVTLDERQWQNLLDFQARLAEYLREIGEPGS